MGYNTTLVIMNDRLHEIDRDPVAWWKNFRAAMDDNDRTPKNGFQFISQEHADTTVVIAVGGNCATVLGYVENKGCHTEKDDQILILESIAERLGYKLVKRSRACPSCRQGTMTEDVISKHNTSLGGIPFVVPNARIWKCSNCDETVVSAREMKRWQDVQRDQLDLLPEKKEKP